MSMKIQPAILALAAVLVGALTLGGALQLQAQTATPPQQQTPTQQPELSQGQIESFASAALQLREIRSKWQPRLQEAENAEKSKELQTQASAEMVKAVEAKGLTVEKYNAIAAAARDNPELAARIAKVMEQSR
jgi:hypothetical protein